MEKNKRMQFYGGTLGACAPLLVFMCLMIVIAAMKKVSLVLFCMAGFAGLCVAFLLAKNKKEFEQAVVDGLKNDTLCVIIFAFLLAGILSQELRQSGLIQGLTWLVMKLGLSAGWVSGGRHLLAVGGFGLAIFMVMAIAGRTHVGVALDERPWLPAAVALLLAAAALRVAAALGGAWQALLAAGLCWMLAFAWMAAHSLPLWWCPRSDGQRGCQEPLEGEG